MLDRCVFIRRIEVWRMAEDWRRRCNHERTNMALDDITPVQKLALAGWLRCWLLQKMRGLPRGREP